MKENTLTHSFQNHYSKRIKHPPQGFLYGKIRMSHKGREFGGFPYKQKSLNFPFCWISPPLKIWLPLFPDHRLHIDKKVSLIAFRKILLKFLPEACIFSNTIMTYLKKVVEIKSFNTRIIQCPAGLSPRIIPHYPRKHLWETLGMGKSPTQQPKISSECYL